MTPSKAVRLNALFISDLCWNPERSHSYELAVKSVCYGCFRPLKGDRSQAKTRNVRQFVSIAYAEIEKSKATESNRS